MIDNFPKKNICVMCPKISLYNYFLKFEEVYAKSFNFARPRNVTCYEVKACLVPIL